MEGENKLLCKENWLLISLSVVSLVFCPEVAWAMHITEGFLPVKWAVIWWLTALPFIGLGIRYIKELIKEEGLEVKILLAVAGAFVFVVSSLKLPSLTGSCSHPTGIGLGAILFGPWPMVVVGMIVLIFQALLLAHGGVTTLGANVFSMAVVGAFAAYGVYKLARKFEVPFSVSVFSAALVGNLMTYVVTSLQLAIAFPADQGGIITSLAKFGGVFIITQLPIAVVEGLLTVLIFNLLREYSPQQLKQFFVLSGGVTDE
jgi:cobalt/nickel transport system permease protein